MKVEIERDSYDFQSSARAYVWSEVAMKWETAASVPYSQMETLRLSAYADKALACHFEDDVQTLMEEVRWLLEGTMA